jgi:hypothetical protein
MMRINKNDFPVRTVVNKFTLLNDKRTNTELLLACIDMILSVLIDLFLSCNQTWMKDRSHKLQWFIYWVGGAHPKIYSWFHKKLYVKNFNRRPGKMKPRWNTDKLAVVISALIDKTLITNSWIIFHQYDRCKSIFKSFEHILFFFSFQHGILFMYWLYVELELSL